MALCFKHTRYYDEQKEKMCYKCLLESNKIVKEKKPQKPNQIKNWRQRCQQVFSEIIRLTYDENGFCKCWISGKWKETFGGLKGIHCGHYFPKSRYWWIEFRYENAGPLSYDENVNQRESIPAIRSKLLEIWGEEKINKLEHDAMIKPKNSDKTAQLLWYQSEYKRLKTDLEKLKKWKDVKAT